MSLAFFFFRRARRKKPKKFEQVLGRTYRKCGGSTALFFFGEGQSGEANDWRNREHVVLDPFSNLKMGKILW